MQRRGIELRQHINAPQAGVDAVGNGDVNEPVFAGERHRGLGAFLRQRKEARALATTHDDGKDVAGVDGLSDGFLCHYTPFIKTLSFFITCDRLRGQAALEAFSKI